MHISLGLSQTLSQSESYLTPLLYLVFLFVSIHNGLTSVRACFQSYIECVANCLMYQVEYVELSSMSRMYVLGTSTFQPSSIALSLKIRPLRSLAKVLELSRESICGPPLSRCQSPSTMQASHTYGLFRNLTPVSALHLKAGKLCRAHLCA